MGDGRRWEGCSQGWVDIQGGGWARCSVVGGSGGGGGGIVVVAFAAAVVVAVVVVAACQRQPPPALEGALQMTVLQSLGTLSFSHVECRTAMHCLSPGSEHQLQQQQHLPHQAFFGNHDTPCSGGGR